MREHKLKTWPSFFRAIWRGDKRFEVRRNDRDFDVGDVLVLQEYEPHAFKFTGAEISAEVTYVLRGGEFGVRRGFAVLGIDVIEALEPELVFEGIVEKDDPTGRPRPRCEPAPCNPARSGGEAAISESEEPAAAAPRSTAADSAESVQPPAWVSTPSAPAGRSAPRWGTAAGGPTWHLWHEDLADAECGETTDAEIVWLPPNVPADPDQQCLDCMELSTPRAALKAIEEPPKKPRAVKNQPSLCIVPGCGNKGAARNQFVCSEHAGEIPLMERRSMLAKWHSVREAAPAVAP